MSAFNKSYLHDELRNKGDNLVYTVYMHINKLNRKKYIGITKNDVNKRWGNGLNYKNCVAFHNAIQKHGWNNFEHVIIGNKLSKEDAENLEIELIYNHNSTNSKYGYNIQYGGSSIGKHSEETKKKISDSESGEKHWNYGKHFSEESKNKMRIAKKDYIGEKHNSSRKVICIETGITYINLREAEDMTGVIYTSISKCCSGKLKKAGGYTWKIVT